MHVQILLVNIVELPKMYNELSVFERALARFGDKCGILASLEIAGKISPEDAYQQIKILYKELKELRKGEKSEWDTPNQDLF